MSVRMLIASVLVLFLSLDKSYPTMVQAEETGAKGLYLEQLAQPQKYLNTGLQYWIELHRGDNVIRTSNKFSFRSRDQIRFHIRANVDGYAYIVLKSGSRGEQSVLFPEPGENNKIERGKDYALPKDGFLTFDENPGLEKVTLLLSRSILDAHAYLRQNQERTLVASAAMGSKDLVPSKILLSYAAPSAQDPQPTAKTKPTPLATAHTSPPKAKGDNAKDTIKLAQDKPTNKHSLPVKPKTRKAPNRLNSAPVIAQKSPQTSPQSQNNGHTLPQPQSQDEGIVTVVYNDPAGVLALDVDLDHI